MTIDGRLFSGVSVLFAVVELLFSARAHGLSWSQISRAMGLGSPQAAQQRFGRITGRIDIEDMLDAIFRDFCIGK